MEDGSCPPAVTPSEAEAEAGAEDYGSWTLKQKLEDLINCDPIHDIMPRHPEHKAYFEKKLEVRHDDIIEHVSSILKSNGIAHSGESIDTGKLECYRYDGGMSIGKSDSQRVGYGETIEADKSSSDTGEVSKMILGKQPPKGSAIKDVRNMFFPYWKSVLSRRLQVKLVPSCQPSRKDLLSAEASRKGTKSIDHPCNPIKSMGNLGSMGWPPLSSESRRMLYTVASMSRKAKADPVSDQPAKYCAASKVEYRDMEDLS
uniref:Uncharacterized protein n=1 Tax=Oryza punctata TaxID=4537 RepID=A0A0E0MBK5_ORYPU